MSLMFALCRHFVYFPGQMLVHLCLSVLLTVISPIVILHCYLWANNMMMMMMMMMMMIPWVPLLFLLCRLFILISYLFVAIFFCLENRYAGCGIFGSMLVFIHIWYVLLSIFPAYKVANAFNKVQFRLLLLHKSCSAPFTIKTRPTVHFRVNTELKQLIKNSANN